MVVTIREEYFLDRGTPITLRQVLLPEIKRATVEFAPSGERVVRLRRLAVDHLAVNQSTSMNRARTFLALEGRSTCTVWETCSVLGLLGEEEAP